MSFYELLRKSRLASFDPSIPQVYTTHMRYRSRGEWGMKRNLPNFLRTNNIIVEALDTIEHQTPYKSAETFVKFTKRWKENYPFSKVSKPMDNKPKLFNIGKMTDKEFKKFLREKVEPKKWEYRNSINNDTKTLQDFINALNITYERKPSTIHGLTYSHNNPGTNIVVQGRVLNKDMPSGFAVGISGMVANILSRKNVPLNQISREKLESFYVEKAEFDSQGKPVVKVSKTPALNLQEALLPLKSYSDPSSSSSASLEQSEILNRIVNMIKVGNDSEQSIEQETTKTETPRFEDAFSELSIKKTS
ncbi:9295_t:CDS:1 [Diversispora eburnea]|uniref:9295_t:CDS:1 n=1 Tax=Diversispora eburnea TaxID=1213867 RepID=A0A9N9A2J5_9GLOM|nr:9295_t:CDS:1 [Diversispora eburnea]